MANKATGLTDAELIEQLDKQATGFYFAAATRDDPSKPRDETIDKVMWIACLLMDARDRLKELSA